MDYNGDNGKEEIMKKRIPWAFAAFFAAMTVSPGGISQTFMSHFWNKVFRQDLSVSKPQAPADTGITAVRPEAVQLLIPSKCETYRPYVEQAKVEMEKRNALEANACQLYKSWAELWRSSECDAQAFADAEAVQCPSTWAATRFEVGAQPSALMRPSCDEIFGKWQTTSNWAHAGIQACDYSLFETGCRPMAEAAEDCGAWQCQQNCTLKYACDAEGFKRLVSATPIYFNDPPRLQGCMDQLRRAGL